MAVVASAGEVFGVVAPVHLRKLQAAGLVSAVIEVSEDGKAMKFYEVTPFALQLTPETILVAARTLGVDSDIDAEVRG